MPRPKTFEPRAVLAQTTELFWEKGFNATSVTDLTERTGLASGSLYLAFKDKEELFKKSLEFYSEEVVSKRMALIDEAPTALQGIRTFFENLVAFYCAQKRSRGCLNTNTAVELSHSNDEIRGLVQKSARRWRSFWMRTLRRAIAEGDVRPDLDVKATADYLYALNQGLNVTAKLFPNRAVLKAIVDQGLLSLES